MNGVDVRDLAGHPGESRAHRFDDPVEGLRVELAEVRPARVNGNVRIDGVEGGVVVAGTLRAPCAFTCARCLTPFEGTVDAWVNDLFTKVPGEDEYALDPEAMDLEPLVRDAVLLALPFSPVCREDCKGLCAECGKNRNDTDCGHPVESSDPRWAGLEQLLEQER